MSHDLLFPEAKLWSDLFLDQEQWQRENQTHLPLAVLVGEPYLPHGKKRRVVPRMKIGPYCFLTTNEGQRADSFNIKLLNSDVLKTLREKMLLIEGDETFFRVWVHPDGTALVTICYNKIIGDTYMARIDSSTIPSVAFTRS